MAESLAFGLLTVVLLAAAVCDARTGLVPKVVTYGGTVAGLVLWTATGLLREGWPGAGGYLVTALVACAAGYIPFAVIFAAGGLGGGDVKLMAAVGAISASWKLVLATSVYAFVLMFVMAVAVMVYRGIVWRTVKRIVSAALVALARVKPELPTDSPKIPFAVATCVGGVVAGVEYLLRVDLPWSGWGP